MITLRHPRATTGNTAPTETTETTVHTGQLGRAGGVVLSIARIVWSFMFACHGVQGLVGAFGGIDTQGTAVPFGQWPGWWASALEVVAGGLVLLGLFTRPAALLCSGAMAYAYFTVHVPLGGLLPIENMGEPAALYSWIFLTLAIIGPGTFALDRVRPA
jgi:putative oxidoreductase